MPRRTAPKSYCLSVAEPAARPVAGPTRRSPGQPRWPCPSASMGGGARLAPPGMRLNVAVFSALDADGVLQRRNENRAGVIVPGLGDPGDGGDHRIHTNVWDHDVDLDPRGEIDDVFLPAVGLGVTSAAIGFSHFAHRQGCHPKLRERLLDLDEFE